MQEKIELSFKDFLAAVQTAKLYGMGHPILKKALEKTFNSIQDVLSDRAEFTIGIIGDEIAFEKEVLFSLSKLAEVGVGYIKERGIERITFNRGIEFAELEKFVSLISIPKEDIKGSPQDHLLSMGVNNISIGKIGVSSNKPTQEEDSFIDIASPLTQIFNREAVDGIALKSSINNIINNLGGQYQQLLKLNTLKRYDLGTFTHIINTSVLSMYFSSKIGFPKDSILEIGLAALFHDIGKLYISRKIIRKPGQLSESEFSQIESHTVLGSTLLLQYVDTLGIMPVVVSFEHHLKYDLSGYPKLSFPRKPNIVSQIVSICDVYDALSARRSYKSDYPPDAIYNLMMRGRGTTYHPFLIDRFFQIVGVWPIGSIVALSDKRVAVVSEENQDDIFAPIVKVIYPEKKESLVDLKNNKDNLKIERYLNPWTEGKDFLHLLV
ncbi:MAG: Cyclic di-GMP phosphodiesterase response regulator RpfG [Candidatus Omnitrophica bacterium ADurb.Bin205]|nr:MAG: Cyclic di-GMP phosphodiesterase response regulator RpfG [Candidatus Omnitrophica bacterium ADurb.Bin205]